MTRSVTMPTTTTVAHEHPARVRMTRSVTMRTTTTVAHDTVGQGADDTAGHDGHGRHGHGGGDDQSGHH